MAMNNINAPTPVTSPFAEPRAAGREAMNQAATSTGTISRRPMNDTMLRAPANPRTAHAQNQPLLTTAPLVVKDEELIEAILLSALSMQGVAFRPGGEITRSRAVSGAR